jgi:hypothetical protein
MSDDHVAIGHDRARSILVPTCNDHGVDTVRSEDAGDRAQAASGRQEITPACITSPTVQCGSPGAIIRGS